MITTMQHPTPQTPLGVTARPAPSGKDGTVGAQLGGCLPDPGLGGGPAFAVSLVEAVRVSTPTRSLGVVGVVEQTNRHRGSHDAAECHRARQSSHPHSSCGTRPKPRKVELGSTAPST